MRSDFVILNPPFHSVRAHTLLAYTPSPPLWHAYFANYYQSKNHKQRYKIKKILFKAIGECQIKIPKRARGSSLHFLTVQRRWKWIILAMWIAHFVLFLLCNEPSKKIYDVPALTAESPSSPLMSQYAFIWTNPLPPWSVHTLWMTPY